jgi:hypothetical protein
MGRRGLAALTGLLLATASPGLLVGRAGASPQETEEQSENEEVVANLAAGQVEILVGRDGVAVGVVGNDFEPMSHPPLVAQLETGQVAVLLGAVDWFYPTSNRRVRLDARLPRLVMESSPVARPHLGAAPAGDLLREVGIALLEPVRKLAASLHAPAHLPDGTPLVELVLLSYRKVEGARVGELDYQARQRALRGDYWQTLVDRPEPFELYPPASGSRGRPIELSYPPGASAGIAARLAKDEPRMAAAARGTEELAQVAKAIEWGETRKVRVRELADFLRAALPACVPQNETATAGRPGRVVAVGVLDDEGFHWVVPLPETELPRAEEAGVKPRAPGAPTLKKKPPK